MFKSIPWLVALSLIAAPVLPVRADSFGVSTFGTSTPIAPDSTLAPQSTFGFTIRSRLPYQRIGNSIIIQRPPTYRYSPYYYPGVRTYPSIYPPRTIIVAPRARTVIIRPGFPDYGRQTCSTTIYGSSIASPILVNPYTGLACR